MTLSTTIKWLILYITHQPALRIKHSIGTAKILLQCNFDYLDRLGPRVIRMAEYPDTPEN